MLKIYGKADTKIKQKFSYALESHALRTRHTGKTEEGRVLRTCDVSILRTVWANLSHENSQFL